MVPCSGQRSLFGRQGGKGRQFRSRCGGAGELGQAEVQKLRPGLGDHDIAGFQIAVHHAGPVRLVQGVRDVGRVGQRFFERKGPLLQSIGQGLTFDVLHDQEVGLTCPANVVKRADVRVVQTGDGKGFALEPLAELGASGEMRRKNLDRDGAIEPRVLGLIDLAHPSRSERGHNLVGT